MAPDDDRNPPAGTEGQTATDDPDTDAQDGDGDQDAGSSQDATNGEADERVQKANREAAKYRKALRETEKRLAELEARLSATDDQSKSEVEKEREGRTAAEKRASELEATLRAERIRNAVLAAAPKHGVRDPEVAYRLLDLDDLDAEAEGDDLRTDVSARIAALVKAHPYLSAASNGGGSSGNPPAGRKVKITPDDLKAMTPEQIAANWDEVQKTLAQSGK